MKIKASSFSIIIWLFLSLLTASSGSSGRTDLRRTSASLQEGNERDLQDESRQSDRNLYDGRKYFLTKDQKKKFKKHRKQRREDRRRNRKRMKGIGQSLLQETTEHFYNGRDKEVQETRIQGNERRFLGGTPKPIQPYFPDMTWLANNLTSIWQLLQQMQKDIKQIRRNNRSQQQSLSRKEGEGSDSKLENDGVETTTEKCNPEWPIDPMSCLDESTGAECSSAGKCICGQCQCEPPYYGIYCQCNDHVCEKQAGVMCGGAGKGQCRCGHCICRPGYIGDSCGCSRSTSSCESDGGGDLCSGRGNCVCDRCQCTDGYTGKWCQDSIYSASVCERLKPCVLCLAFGRNYPQCEECKIKVEHVDELELSQTTCVMINLGCIVKYAYSKSETSDEIMNVFVPKGMSCPP